MKDVKIEVSKDGKRWAVKGVFISYEKALLSLCWEKVRKEYNFKRIK